jgi:hypothetical protein
MARGVETCDLTPRRGEPAHNPSSFLDHSHSSPPPLRVPETVTLPTVRGMAAPPAPVPDLTTMTVNLASGPSSAHYFHPPSTTGPKTFLQVLLSSAPAPINTADGKRSRRARSLPPAQNQCFRCLSTDHLVAACRDPVRCRSCLRHGHQSYSCETAGTFSRSLRPGASQRSSPGADSASPPCFTSPPPTSVRSAWLSPTIDRRVERGSVPVPTTAAGRQRSRSPTPAARGRDALPSVHFAPTPLGAAAAGPPRHRAWRSATPFIPRGASLAPADAPVDLDDDITQVHMPAVDMEPSRRLAYAFVEPACADPRIFIRLALEQRGGDPPSNCFLLPTSP